MAKKKETSMEMPVDERLKTLFQLQTLLSEIDKIKTLRGELPLEVQDLEDELEGLRTRIQNTENEIATLKKESNGYKNTEALNMEKVAKYQQQLETIRSNRDYDILTKEIEFVNSDIELCKKRRNEADAEIKQKEEFLKKSKEDFEEHEKDLEIKKNELDDIVAETKADEEKLREKAKDIEVKIEQRLLTSFKRIRKNCHNGLGIVYVQRDSCGGCFAKIPPQRQLDVKMHKKIIVCEYCGRILIDPELAGVKTAESAKEEKPKRKRTLKRRTEDGE
jgi:hypothetical protein